LISVNGTAIGEFNGGQSVNFNSFPGGGVSEFTISQIEPLVGTGDANGFALRLGFTSALGSFSSNALVPEPSSVALLLVAAAFGGCARNRRGR
jgi:hypothetical protein